MKIKIVADSSANLYTLDGGVEFVSAPLTIRTDEREFVDTADLDVRDMVDYLSKYKGKSGSACPGVGDYLDAFGDADEIYCVTIRSGFHLLDETGTLASHIATIGIALLCRSTKCTCPHCKNLFGVGRRVVFHLCQTL